MNSLLSKASRRFLILHPWQLGLAILGITLGVAVVIAIDLALESSLLTFEQTGKVFSGKTTHRIVAADGGLDEHIYSRLRTQTGIQKLSPVLRGRVYLPGNSEKQVLLYGIDPLAEQSFNTVWQANTNHNNNLITRLISEPNTVLISRKLAISLKLQAGDALTVKSSSGERRLTVIALLSPDNPLIELALQNTLICDIATAQELLGWYGKLTAIDVIIDDKNNQKIDQITDLLPANALLTTPENQKRAMQQMTQAFSINLRALGLLSLLVGMFLIYNTMTFLVVQRRSLLGRLRCIGVTRKQIFKLIYLETTALSVLGSICGIALGVVLGQGLLHLVSGTIDNLFYRIDQVNLWVTSEQIFKGFILGVVASWAAILLPALEATRVAPASVLRRSQLETGVTCINRFVAGAGTVLIVIGLGLSWLSGKSISFGLAGLFLLIFGFALWTPLLTWIVMAFIERIGKARFGILGRLPPRMVNAEISRTGIAIAALMIAVSATIGIDLMTGSFRQTVEQWLQTTLRADLYISLSGNSVDAEKPGKDRLLKMNLANLPDVAKLSSVLHTQVIVEDHITRVSVFELNDLSKAGFIFKQGEAKQIWPRFIQPHTVIITEAYAYFNGLKIGNMLNLQTDKGLLAFEIIGVYADYSGDRGHLAMSRDNYLRYWPDLGYSGIGVYPTENAQLDILKNRINALLTGQQQLLSNHDIFTASMRLFKQTFSITDKLRWLAATIAIVGVFSALMALQFERTRQLGVLRAIGVTPKQLTVLIGTETGLMGLTAGLFALPVGFIVAYLLIHLIYQRAFGWTMVFYFHPSTLLQGIILAFCSALVAGILPALKMARTKPAEALRYE